MAPVRRTAAVDRPAATPPFPPDSGQAESGGQA